MENVNEDNIQYLAFMNEDCDKHEQFHVVRTVKSRCCVMCEGKKPGHTGYFEPNDKSGLKDPKSIRIWYFICDFCLKTAEPMAIDKQIIQHILSLKN